MSINDINATVDGGQLQNLDTTFSVIHLYDSGNIFYDFQTSLDADVEIVSGTYYSVYQIQNKNYSILPSNNFNFISPNIIYNTTSLTSIITGQSILDNSIKKISLFPNSLPSYVDGITNGTLYKTPTNFFNYTFLPKAFSPSNDLLIVYNADNQESIDITNYYLSVRTGFKNCNTLGLTGLTSIFSGDTMYYPQYMERVKFPIVNYIRDSNKPIKYIVLMYNLPCIYTGDYPYATLSSGGESISNDIMLFNKNNIEAYIHSNSLKCPLINSGVPRVSGFIIDNLNLGGVESPTTNYSSSFSVGKNYNLTRFTGTPCLVTHVTAKNKQDISGYITKLKNSQIVSGYFVRPNTNLNNHFLIRGQGVSGLGDYQSQVTRNYAPYVGQFSNINLDILTGKWPISNPRITGSNIAFLLHWGTHSTTGFDAGDGILSPFYPNDGGISLTGNNNWYIHVSEESFNGQNFFTTGVGAGFSTYDNNAFGTPFRNLSSGAFGGTGYENCPIGMLANCREPGGAALHFNSFQSWLSGHPFIECACDNDGGLNPLGSVIIAIGDPFVIR